MSFLIGEKVILRPVEASDIDGPYHEWINVQEADVFTEHAQFPHSRDDLESYLKSRNEGSGHIWLAIVDKAANRHVGNIELAGIDWVHGKATYSIIVGDESAQGKGFGFEASVMLLRHAFGKLNLHRVELGVHENNIPAVKLYRKLGFVEEGRLRQAFRRDGKYHDMIIMGLLSDEFCKAHPDGGQLS
jgi:RimJ/RimL family protein N-acetyltransferase